MSDTDSFIDEVTEEVRRDRLFALLKRYGWIAILVIVVIVGGAAWNEYRKAQARSQAQALGDAMLAALSRDDSAARADALAGIDAGTPGARAVLGFLQAAEAEVAGQRETAAAALESIAAQGDLPLVYRQIAAFKALTLQSDTLAAEDRRAGFEALAVPGQPLRLLAEEQLALIDIETGNRDAAVDRLQGIISDSEATPDLQRRALQVIVALGGEPDLSLLVPDDGTGDN